MLYLKELFNTIRGFRQVQMAEMPLSVCPADRRFWDLIERQAWEPETLETLRLLIKPGTRYCDIGSWIGPTVLYAHHLGAEVTCFEPDPLAFERLLGNLRLNGVDDVRTVPFALGKKDGIRKMGAMVGSLGKSATSFLGTSAQQTIESVTITWKTALRLLEKDEFDVIKMDIEGGEAELLPELMDYLAKVRPSLLLSTHWSFLPEDGRQSLMDSLNALVKIYPASRTLEGPQSQPLTSFETSDFLRHSSFLFSISD